MIQYKSVPGPVGITISKKEDYASAVKQYASIIDSEAVGGWRFECIRKIPVTQKAGCLASLFGSEDITLYVNMLVFSKDDSADISSGAINYAELSGVTSEADGGDRSGESSGGAAGLQNDSSDGEPDIRTGNFQGASDNADDIHQPDNKKKIAIFAGAGAVLLLIICILIGSGNSRNNYYEPDYDDYEYSDYDYEDYLEEQGLGDVDVESEVSRIREVYYRVISSISNGSCSEKEIKCGPKTATAYFDDGELCCVMVAPHDSVYVQGYFYENEELIFAYSEINEESNRCYFVDEKMIRWRYCPDAYQPDEGYNNDLIFDERGMYLEIDSLEEAQRWLEISYDDSSAPRVGRFDISSVSASSYLDDPEYGIGCYPEAVIEQRPETAWVEGAPGDGIGESITLRLNDTYTVSGFEIWSGVQDSDDSYEKNSRPKKLLIIFSDGSEEMVKIKDKGVFQTITFDKPVETNEVTFVIDSVYSGSQYQNTAISYIELF